MYMHDTLASDDKNLDALKLEFTSQFGKLEKSLNNMKKHLEEKDSEMKLLKEKHDAL